MDAAKIFEGIALLMELAQRGEINPWDVQVIEVIDRYLSQIISVGEIRPSSYEDNLSQSGQAFLLASLLVLFKANTLTELESPPNEQEPSADDFLPLDEAEGVTRLRLPLEQQLSRRPCALPPPKRQVTLKDLIDQLQLIATGLQSQEHLANKAKRHRRLGTQSDTQATKGSPLELAHQENLTEVAGELEECLNRYPNQILARERDWLNLEQVVELWTQTKQAAKIVPAASRKQVLCETDNSSSQRHERVSIFWALLLLSAQSKVELSQEEFYQEIKIRTLFDAKQLAIADTDTKAEVCSC